MTHSDVIAAEEHALLRLRNPGTTRTAEQQQALIHRAKDLLKARDATLVAHYYSPPEMQRLADETGGCVSDSLEMARFGARQAAATLVVAGVRFMGETAKILNPEKRVLMPDLGATCSLDLGCPIERFSAFAISTPTGWSWCMPIPVRPSKRAPIGSSHPPSRSTSSSTWQSKARR